MLIGRYLSGNTFDRMLLTEKKNGHLITTKQVQGREGKSIAVYQGPELRINLSNPMTGCKAPARRTSFFILGEECTRFPITPT